MSQEVALRRQVARPDPLLVGGFAVAVALGATVGTGYGLEALGVLAVLALTILALLRPVPAVLAALSTRFVADMFGNGLSASAATLGVTLLGAWVALVAALGVASRRERLNVGRPLVLLLTLAGWVAYRGLDVAWSEEANRETGQFLSLAITFFAGAAVFAAEDRVRTLARFICVAAVAETAFGVFQVVTGQALAYSVYMRAFGTFPHPSWLAMFLVLGIVMLPATGWERRTTVIVGAVLLGGVVLTFSRGPLVFLLTWALAYAVVSKRTRIAVAGITCAGGLLLIPEVRDRFLGEYQDGRLTGSYLSRTLLRDLAVNQWEQHRWIGEGTAAFFADTSPRVFNGESIEAHSDVFKLLADQGLIGLGLYLAVVLAVFAGVRRVRGPWRTSVMALVLTVPVMGVLDVYYRQNTMESFLWLLIGGCWAIGRQWRAGSGCEVVGDDLVGRCAV